MAQLQGPGYFLFFQKQETVLTEDKVTFSLRVSTQHAASLGVVRENKVNLGLTRTFNTVGNVVTSKTLSLTLG